MIVTEMRKLKLQAPTAETRSAAPVLRKSFLARRFQRVDEEVGGRCSNVWPLFKDVCFVLCGPL